MKRETKKATAIYAAIRAGNITNIYAHVMVSGRPQYMKMDTADVQRELGQNSRDATINCTTAGDSLYFLPD